MPHICSIALICLAAPQQWELQQHPFPAKHCASMPPGGNPLFAGVLSWHIFLYISQLAPGMENCNSNSTQLKREDNNSQNRWISANDPWPAFYKEVTSTTIYVPYYCLKPTTISTQSPTPQLTPAGAWINFCWTRQGQRFTSPWSWFCSSLFLKSTNFEIYKKKVFVQKCPPCSGYHPFTM